MISERSRSATAREVASALRDAGLGKLQPMLLDRTYTALPMATWASILAWSDVDRVQYVAERRDCDNFALALAGQVGLRLSVNGCGVVVDYSGQHAYCVLLVEDTARGGIYARLVEPQSDGLPQVGDSMSGHEAYKAERGVILFA